MERVKEITKEYLKQDIEWKRFGIRHPVFEQEYHWIDGKCKSIKDARDLVEAKWAQEIDEATSLESLMVIINTGYKFKWLKDIRSLVSNKDFSKLLGMAWKRSPAPWEEVPEEELREWFLSARKSSLMDHSEYEMYKSLPKRKTLYRYQKRWYDTKGEGKRRVSKDRICAVFRDISCNEYIII